MLCNEDKLENSANIPMHKINIGAPGSQSIYAGAKNDPSSVLKQGREKKAKKAQVLIYI